MAGRTADWMVAWRAEMTAWQSAGTKAVLMADETVGCWAGLRAAYWAGWRAVRLAAKKADS